jgi:hypothetical protein
MAVGKAWICQAYAHRYKHIHTHKHAWLQVKRGSTGAFVFALITYVFPILSAKAVPDLQAWAKEWSEYEPFACTCVHYACVCAYICMCAYMCMCACMCMCANMCVCVYTCVRVLRNKVSADKQMRAWIYYYMYVRVYVHICAQYLNMYMCYLHVHSIYYVWYIYVCRCLYVDVCMYRMHARISFKHTSVRIRK